MLTNSLQNEGQKTQADVDLLCATFTGSMPMCCHQLPTLWFELVDELPECRCNRVHCACVSYLVIQGQVTESWDVLGPLHQDQELLLHGLTHVGDGSDLFSPDVPVEYGSRGRDLAETAVCRGATPHFYL